MLLLAAPLISVTTVALKKTILAIKQTEPDDLNRQVLLRNLENISVNNDSRNLEQSLATIERTVVKFDLNLQKVVISAIYAELQRKHSKPAMDFKEKYAGIADTNVARCLNEYTKPAKTRIRKQEREEFITTATNQILKYANQKRSAYKAEHTERLLAPSTTARRVKGSPIILKTIENQQLEVAAEWTKDKYQKTASYLQELIQANAYNIAEQLKDINANLMRGYRLPGYVGMLVKSAICLKIKAVLGYELRSNKIAQDFIRIHGQTLSFDEILKQLKSVRRSCTSDSEVSTDTEESTETEPYSTEDEELPQPNAASTGPSAPARLKSFGSDDDSANESDDEGNYRFCGSRGKKGNFLTRNCNLQ
jgi:hypothetical protein